MTGATATPDACRHYETKCRGVEIPGNITTKIRKNLGILYTKVSVERTSPK